MKQEKLFIAISSVISNNKITYLTASNGQVLADNNGLKVTDIINFMYNLRKEYGKQKVVFVSYNFIKASEFIFSELNNNLKSELFQNFEVRKELENLIDIKKDLETKFYDNDIELSEDESIILFNELTDISRAIGQTGKIEYNGFTITLQQGKSLTIKKNKHTFVLYDVFGYFRKPLRKIINQYFLIDLPELEDTFNLIQKADLTAQYVASLTASLYAQLQSHGIELSRFHGASTVTSAVLSKAKARDEYKNFKTEKSLSSQMIKASRQAFYGGRTEQLKLGRFENVNVYDMNSAYAKACLFLPKMLRRPLFSSVYLHDEKFSVWYIEYQLPENIFYGFLPNRENFQMTKYKRKGKGYFWKPEIDFLIANYPDCITIKQGFYVPFVQTDFSRAIVGLYEIRQKLKAENNPIQEVIKLALAVIYGKFCQRVGMAYYYNMWYAGYVTSYVRAELLKAAHSFERQTICFLTDAIHTTARLSVAVSDNVGDFRYTAYDSGVYLGAGIYQLKREDKTKEATRGFTTLDFDLAFAELKTSGYYKVFQDFFIGYNLHTLAPMKFNNYLGVHKNKFKVNPLNSKLRLYDALKIDLETENTESKIYDTCDEQESKIYNPSVSNEFDFMNTAITAFEG